MRFSLPHRALLAGFILTHVACGCQTRSEPVPAQAQKAPQAVVVPATEIQPLVPNATPVPTQPPVPPETVDEPPPASDLPSQPIRRFDVGPAGPATASKDGVVMITRDDQVLLARLSAAGVEPVSVNPENLVSWGRGPAVLGDFAYFISGGRLLRRRTAAAAALQVLATDARDGTRVQVARVRGKVAVAYIAKLPPDRLVARLWLEPNVNLLLSPDESSANSVSLAEDEGNLWAVSLEARTGMSSLHARVLSAPEKSRLSEDVVLWVGGTTQPMTEVHLGPSPSGLFAFLPIERDISSFGLARLALGNAPQPALVAAWMLYPNGLDPAPFDVAKVCGETFLLSVTPVDASPGARQQLQVRAFDGQKIGAALTLANSRVFTDISFAESNARVLFSYVADRKTWALLTDCAALRKLLAR